MIAGFAKALHGMQRENRRKQERIDELQQQVKRLQQELARPEEVLLEDRQWPKSRGLKPYPLDL